MPKWTDGSLITITVSRVTLEVAAQALKSLVVSCHYIATKDKRREAYYRELADRADGYAEHLRRLLSDR